ncbi:phosphatidylinositol-specific phospholipase C [Candidatus Symbiopectobacterium sp. NZEC127]|uniref:phosphatidylinositol-specific phospholipase C n=1 Tax=Candidatus Symbiopectobacterium sp. NZEC127 TaxID=2820472 RepID=UPI002226D261|nr:phosphatidylinositol-specific phospholipase C [Candidatus Symbiopectobacterium sp. NZEC127]MCW2488738.1 phosphatidylinositol-specific phospholipase C [Candidatus Symbiopectobacterium sp. NZEC127]
MTNNNSSDYEKDNICHDNPITPFAARQVNVTFNNYTDSVLHLSQTRLMYGLFNPSPPTVISARRNARWATESNGGAAGTEALAEYNASGSNLYFELYWSNPLIGNNSYRATINNNFGQYVIFAAGTSGNHSAVTFTTFKNNSWNYNSWMGGIDGTRLISRLSIPGTHQSGAREDHGTGLIACQDMTISEQLLYGIRFLDIRCRAIDGVFTIHHGPAYQGLNFGEVLNQCISFLNQNPSETILMRVKQEYSTVSDTEFIRIFNEQYGNYHSRMYLNTATPSLDQVRNKIVILANVSGLPGIHWSSMNIQDNYNPNSTEEKVQYIQKHLALTIDNHSNGGNSFFVNFISQQGTFVSDPIYHAALWLNPIFLTLMLEKLIHPVPPEVGVGIIPMDFPNNSPGVVHGIINSNFE